MTDNFQALGDTRHMLQWLADEPYEEIRSSVESILREQVADSRQTRERIQYLRDYSVQ